MASLPLRLDFRLSFGLFHGLNLVSLSLVSFLFVIYWMGRRNMLLRSGCILCIGISTVLLWNWTRGGAHVTGGPFCHLQAVMLNYAYVALHGHFCFFMVNSCFSALNWPFLGSRRPELRTTLFILAAWLIPMLPTGFAVWRYLDGTRSPIILARPFYCSVKSPSWPLFRGWFFLFSGPGLFFSFYLLYRTWRYRRNTLHLSKTTHIDASELFRLVLTILLYLVLIGLSLGGSHLRRGLKLHVKTALFNVPSTQNPYLNPHYCVSCDPRTEYACAVLCPTAKSFLPVVVGVCLFAMYGFGAVARKFYRRLGRRVGIDSCSGSGAALSGGDTASIAANSVSSAVGGRFPLSTASGRNSLPVSLSSADLDSSRFDFGPPTITTSGVVHSYSNKLQSQSHSNSNATSHSHQHHPTLPSIDEDLEVFYLSTTAVAAASGLNQTNSNNSNSNSGHALRHMQRRFSEPCPLPPRR